MDTLIRDVGYALTMMRRNKGFAAAGLLTLALGIGATTAVFSVVYGVLLRPLPYPNADRLVRLSEEHRAELRPSSIELSAVDGRMTWSRHSRRIDPIPTSCPACQSSSIGTTAKIPDADNYWRCENCGEVWNASRSQTDWYRGQRWR